MEGAHVEKPTGVTKPLAFCVHAFHEKLATKKRRTHRRGPCALKNLFRNV